MKPSQNSHAEFTLQCVIYWNMQDVKYTAVIHTCRYNEWP